MNQKESRMFSFRTAFRSRRETLFQAHGRPELHRGSVAPAGVAAVPRRRLGRFAVAAAAILVLGFGPSMETVRAATYTVIFENRTSSTIWVVAMERGEDGCLTNDGTHGDYWSVHGWVEVLPGRSATYRTTHNGFYYYAHNADGTSWGGQEGDGSFWGDDFLVYVRHGKFQYCRPNDGSGGSPGADYYQVPMRGIIPDGRDGNGTAIIPLVD
jgi:hypothetical protein